MKVRSSFSRENERNLAGEFCVVAGEFSDLQHLMNTLSIYGPAHHKSPPGCSSVHLVGK